MNGSAKKMMAMLAVVAMIASAMVVVFADEQNASADALSDANKYYYDRLDPFAQKVYDKVVSVSSFEESNRIITITSGEVEIPTDFEMTCEKISKGILSAGYDDPRYNYYVGVQDPEDATKIIMYHNDSFDPGVSVTFTLRLNPFFDDKTKATCDDQMATDITAIKSGIDTSQPMANVVESIHNNVAGTLTYADSGEAGIIRSVYTAISGSHDVVCEGYAKMFRVLCKECDIPCIIVTGEAGTTGPKVNHMWNYVKINDDWFLVDCTWDDQDTLTFEYLLAGWSTEGFSSVIVDDSHIPSGINFSTVMPSLSYYSYNDLQTRTQHLVTFKSYEDRVYTQIYCGDGRTVRQPEDPNGDLGDHFFGWYIGDEEYNFSNGVTSDITIMAKWSSVKVFTLRYDSNGGTDVQATREETSDDSDPNAPSKVMKITNSVPFRDGFKFVEWNTAKDGTGLSYKSGDDIVLTTDEYTLYAIWEDTNSVNYKINSFVDKAAAFLGGETVPGVSNMLLTILVITAAVSLLAILAISRK